MKSNKKLNKRKCREFADPGLKMCLDNGILYANQISYVVRTAVKIIDHHKILILYVYPREQAVQGNSHPLYTVFQAHDEFATLEMREDGSMKWRTAAFDRLDGDHHFTYQCAFYSPKDAERIGHYFKDGIGGFLPLVKAQESIVGRCSHERQRKKESRIVSRMSVVKSLPRGLQNWIHKSVMPAYFFYDYQRGGNDVPGVCSACGREIRLSGVKQYRKASCPHCRHELIAKPRSRRGSNMYDRDTVQVIQDAGNGELVVRIVKIYYNYKNDTPKVQIYENARHFIYQDSDGEIRVESYYYSYNNGLLTNWKKGERPAYLYYQYSFEADAQGHLYTKNLPGTLSGTPWQYCPIDDFYRNFREPLLSIPFLYAYVEHPRLEHLVKTGFYSVAYGLAYQRGTDCLDESQHRTHRILQVAAEDVAFLRELDPNIATLKIFQKYAGIKGRKELVAWQINHDISRDVMQILAYMTPHKAMRYLDSQYGFLQFRKTPQGGQRYDSMQDLVSEYRDYLEICSGLGYDMKNSFILYPKDLQKSHDKAMHRKKNKENAKHKREFTAIYRQIAGKLDFEDNGMKIVYPSKPDDMIAEGHALHHCVDIYVSRVAKKECVILFLRQCSDESKPFYTIEVRGNKAVQVRGIGNCSMTPEVQKFIKAWERHVLSRVDLAA